jgi:hypothetical protein
MNGIMSLYLNLYPLDRARWIDVASEYVPQHVE